MPHDFKHKEPSKTEKVLYELMMNQQGMERALWFNSSVIMAVATLLGVEPKKIAETLVNDEKLKEFSNQINAEIKNLQAAKTPQTNPQEKIDSESK